MATAANAIIKYEAGQDATAMSALTDSGDHQKFETTAVMLSRKSGYEPDVRPNGILTGGIVTPAASGSNDVVDGAALTCYLAGVKTTVTADADLAITRGLTTNTHIINSITINSSGAYAVIAGDDHTAFSETRGAAGGPPFIPVGSIEVAQVRLTSITAAPVIAAEIFAVPGQHREESMFPVPSINYYDNLLGVGSIEFSQALPLSHTGSVTKKVYASYSEPLFVNIEKSVDFVPPETTNSTSSTQIYNGQTIGSTSSTLNQGSFKAYLNDGVTDSLIGLKSERLWFEFYPDKNKTQKIIANGILGIKRTFPAANEIMADCTISPDFAAIEIA